MALRVVRLGSPRRPDEGVRLGTVRRPPRGVRREDLARLDYYDVWLPVLAPSAELVALGRSATTDAEWRRFERGYLREMAASDPAGVLDLLAAASPTVELSVGCYCEDEARCHRSLLGGLLAGLGAVMAGP
ncbi:MAG: DUF488 family protein, partial [Acidimicrobiales bacterium]|nr:DUF488 family protein [Acidimicrobiales bacterium]